MTRRSPFSTLFLLGFGLVLGAALFGAPGTTSTLLAAPFIALGFVFKVLFFVFMFGLVARALGKSMGQAQGDASQRHGGPPWMRHGCHPGSGANREGSDEHRASRSERFEEWHRMAHAREEVDDYAPPVED